MKLEGEEGEWELATCDDLRTVDRKDYRILMRKKPTLFEQMNLLHIGSADNLKRICDRIEALEKKLEAKQ